MKLIKTKFSFNNPKVNQVNVKTNSDYMVAIEIEKNGENISLNRGNTRVYDPSKISSLSAKLKELGLYYSDVKNDTDEPVEGWIKIAGDLLHQPHLTYVFDNKFMSSKNWKFSYDNGTTWIDFDNLPEDFKMKIQCNENAYTVIIKKDGKVYDENENLIEGRLVYNDDYGINHKNDFYVWGTLEPHTNTKWKFDTTVEIPDMITLEDFREHSVIQMKSSDKAVDRKLMVNYKTEDGYLTDAGVQSFGGMIDFKLHVTGTKIITREDIYKTFNFKCTKTGTSQSFIIENVSLKGCIGFVKETGKTTPTMSVWLNGNGELNIMKNGAWTVVNSFEIGNDIPDGEFYFSKSFFDDRFEFTKYDIEAKLVTGDEQTFYIAVNEEDANEGDVGSVSNDSKTLKLTYLTEGGEERNIEVLVK